MQSTGLMLYHKFQVVLVLNKDIKLSNGNIYGDEDGPHLKFRLSNPH